jgi:shikimate kinase
MRIFLIGFMGSGKSYTGKRLAATLGYDFYDLDALIEAQEGCKIAAIFEEKGEARFREIEQQTLHRTADWEDVVISCGGGTPCFFDNMEWMNARGITIWLDPAVKTVLSRLQRKPHKRPLLAGLDTEAQWMEFIERKLEERRPFYEKAQLMYRQTNEEADAAEELVTLIQSA